VGATSLLSADLFARTVVAPAVLPQESTLNFPFTVLEVVLMGRAPHLKGAEGEHDYEIARAALDVVEARHLEERLYPTLSSGERQRVPLARVIRKSGSQQIISRATFCSMNQRRISIRPINTSPSGLSGSSQAKALESW
jgi:ABC-type hemin transport system ATPase subunit